MFCSCSCSDDHQQVAVKIRVIPILLGLGVFYAASKLLAGSQIGSATPTPQVLPIILLAAAVTSCGLWLNYKIHKRGEPLAVAAFGMLIAAVGYLVYQPLLVVGACIVISAAVWGANIRSNNERCC